MTSIKCWSDRSAVLRFSAFNLRTTPEINGTITRVSADTTTDQRTGQSYYVTRIAMTKNEIARLGDIKLIPGMPVEAFVQTGERTRPVLSSQALARSIYADFPGKMTGTSFRRPAGDLR